MQRKSSVCFWYTWQGKKKANERASPAELLVDCLAGCAAQDSKVGYARPEKFEHISAARRRVNANVTVEKCEKGEF